MRFSRALPALAVLLAACPDEKPAGPVPSRFDAVTKKPSAEAARFCDQTWPAEGEKSRAWQSPSLRPLEGAPPVVAAKGWRWVNAWATWCTPCVEEMALLSKWRDAFAKDGLEVSFEFLSVDSPEAEPELRKWLPKVPGAVTWVSSPDDFPAWMEKAAGLSRDSAIPIHLLVDPAGKLRCVRVGAVHAQDYGTVRAVLSGS